MASSYNRSIEAYNKSIRRYIRDASLVKGSSHVGINPLFLWKRIDASGDPIEQLYVQSKITETTAIKRKRRITCVVQVPPAAGRGRKEGEFQSAQ